MLHPEGRELQFPGRCFSSGMPSGDITQKTLFFYNLEQADLTDIAANVGYGFGGTSQEKVNALFWIYEARTAADLWCFWNLIKNNLCKKKARSCPINRVTEYTRYIMKQRWGSSIHNSCPTFYWNPTSHLPNMWTGCCLCLFMLKALPEDCFLHCHFELVIFCLNVFLQEATLEGNPTKSSKNPTLVYSVSLTCSWGGGGCTACYFKKRIFLI